MELSLAMRFRIGAAVAVGVVLIGIFAWPLAVPAEPFGAVRAGSFGFTQKLVLLLLAILTGFIAYFPAWPYGREIAILAVPSGLALWAVRSGDMAQVLLLNPSTAGRLQLYAALKREPLFWLAVVAAGFAGVIVAQIIVLSAHKSLFAANKDEPETKGRLIKTILAFGRRETTGQLFSQVEPATKSRAVATCEKSGSVFNISLKAAAAVFVSVLVAQACIAVFARDVKMFDSSLGSLVAQPGIGQVVFAVLVSFALAGFLVKVFLNLNYVWPIIASAFVTAFVDTFYLNRQILQQLSQDWPVVFFPQSAVCILPVQMVAFGALGSIAGYWMAVRYNHWRKNELN